MTKDINKAKEWYAKAAAYGHDDAQTQLDKNKRTQNASLKLKKNQIFSGLYFLVLVFVVVLLVLCVLPQESFKMNLISFKLILLFC